MRRHPASISSWASDSIDAKEKGIKLEEKMIRNNGKIMNFIDFKSIVFVMLVISKIELTSVNSLVNNNRSFLN